MKAGELGKEIGKTAMEIGRIRSKLLPDSQPDMTVAEINKIKEYLDVVTYPQTITVLGYQSDNRFPDLVEATNDKQTERYTIQIPRGFMAKNFVGRHFKVQKREYAPGQFVYEYNPYKQDD